MTDTVLFDYWRSSASYRVRIALNMAGIAYQAVSVDLVTGDHRSAAHLQRNPQGLVPVLEIDGHRLTQSLAILSYLDQTRDLGLLPKDPVQRAHVEALAQAIAVDIHPVCNLRVAVHASKLAGDDGTKEAWMKTFIRPGLEAFETMLAQFDQAPYCCGGQIMLPDLCLIPQLYNADRWGVATDDLPRISAVQKALADHPAFAAALPEAVQP